MAQIFPRWSNRLPVYLAGGTGLFALSAAIGIWYFFSPEFTDVGYQPRQPIPFSHKLHVGELKIDCRYCHAAVEISAVASVPSTQTCMNCHHLVGRDAESLSAVRESISTGQPIQWIRVHKLPEYAYFNHSVHIDVGIGCSSCHGNVAQMDRIMQVEPLSMGWCLDCHRQPERYLRSHDQITDTAWSPSEDQSPLGGRLYTRSQIDPPTDCSACHQ